MIYLGISEDLFDSGVALCDDSRILFAANEERYTRRKNEGGFPHRTLEAAFACAGIAPADVDRIVFSGIMTPPALVRLFPRLHDWLFDALRQRERTLFKRLMNAVMFMTPVSHTRPGSTIPAAIKRLLPLIARRSLPASLRKKDISFVEHHHAHAYGAWSMSGYSRALAITADGMGDGVSLTVSLCEEGKGVERLWTAPSLSSFGLFFEMLTEAFGFVSCRDEGKLTGLAAHGDPARVAVPPPFQFRDGQLLYTGPLGLRGADWARQVLLTKYSREDISAWAQNLLETHITNIARHWLKQTSTSRLVVAGGVFANVKLNQRLHEMDEVEQLFVYPNMGDGGLSLGAIRADTHAVPQAVDNVFLGDGFAESEIPSMLRAAELPFEQVEDSETAVADLVARGKIVARCQGRMEWGPRALGNRSILVRASDRTQADRLNKLLARSDFMPFAPALLAEDAPEWLEGYESARHAAEFMTVCFRCNPRMKNEHPAVVHVDGTARAQLVARDNNPGFHQILRRLKEKTGSSVILNTSFNIHEDPIVRTPQEAIDTFKRARLDFLAMGNCIAGQPKDDPENLRP
ncbi:MAG TPA: carbamoyltransferase C-terminal domain-containing protein [Candidatus Hydrogenedentes bacterium]|nr:carbamoyltransferase C-terminal domain-containing protein [Candidatus Hydrogenedentota bacterium]HPC16273.1 carbamoyltransferase C-terminal domain-containing protein [Candidatus Hydrogenedentota bacterium]HRT21655.1 carbamoyltransferase C-terminal domain-containing protein [Candidatus Hydrogenedentota bacterium]HRT66895.1 carbamoyltransferase C-terminal domain-containing protein [Candidatus Hydrogenedentota bacterium]